MRKQKGFSLIELLIVVAIILIIAAIAIPNLLRARIAANEASAASGVRTINTAEVSYYSNWPGTGFSLNLVDLGDVAGICAGGAAPTALNACLLDNVMAQDGNPPNSGKSGYTYIYASVAGVGGINTGYVLTSNAVTQLQTGVKGFCAVQDAVVRFANPGPIAAGACAAAQPLQ